MRKLRFTNLEDAIVEIKRLESIPKSTTGVWSYYQILNHCADFIDFCINGYPMMAPWAVRMTIGQFIKHKTFLQGYMDPKSFNPTAPTTREEGDELKAQERLLKSIERFKVYSGKLHKHPFFDQLNKDEFEKLHAYHIANHLSYIE
jgi:hypothetical protein